MDEVRVRARPLRHDLRNALFSIQGFHDTLLKRHREKVKPLQRQLASVIQTRNELEDLRRRVFRESSNTRRSQFMAKFVRQNAREIQTRLKGKSGSEVDAVLEDILREKNVVPLAIRYEPTHAELSDLQAEAFRHGSAMAEQLESLIRGTRIRHPEVRQLLEGMLGGARHVRDISLSSDPGGERVFDLREVALNAASPRAYGKNKTIAIDVQLPREEVGVHGEKGMVTTMLHNLIDNAVKHSQSRQKPRVRVEVTLDRQNGHAIVHVHDNGPGIPDKKIDEILGKESRNIGQKPGEREGLAIVKETAERHDAKLHIQSNRNGTTFSVKFKTHSG